MHNTTRDTYNTVNISRPLTTGAYIRFITMSSLYPFLLPRIYNNPHICTSKRGQEPVMLLHFYDGNIYIYTRYLFLILKNLYNFLLNLFQTYHEILFFVIILNLIK